MKHLLRILTLTEQGGGVVSPTLHAENCPNKPITLVAVFENRQCKRYDLPRHKTATRCRTQ